MLYICYGMPKSGSTLAFELTCGLLSACGHPQEKLPPPYIEERFQVNYVGGRHAWSQDKLHVLAPFIDHPQILAVKTHAPPTEDLFSAIESGWVQVQAIYRDPRDNVLSLMDASLRALSHGRSAFRLHASVDVSVRKCKEDIRDLKKWQSVGECLSADYEAVAFESEAFLRRVAAQLNLDIKGIDLAALIQRVKRERFTQFNKGIRSRHRRDLTLEQTIALTAKFCDVLPEMKALSPLDQALVQEARAMPEDKVLDRLSEIDRQHKAREKATVKAQKTYVVLGSPRGGTSLIAGSLKVLGVYMGENPTEQYEDPDFKLTPREAALARKRLSPVIARRNREHEFWGWKLPNNIYYIREVVGALINPVFIFVYRSPLEIARSSCKHDRRDWSKEKANLLRAAERHTAMVRAFQDELPESAEVHEFQLEAIQANPAAFADAIVRITNRDQEFVPEVLSFINPGGGYNRKLLTRKGRPRKATGKGRGLWARLKRRIWR